MSANAMGWVSGVVMDTANALPLNVVGVSACAGSTEDGDIAKSPIIEIARIAYVFLGLLICCVGIPFNVFGRRCGRMMH